MSGTRLFFSLSLLLSVTAAEFSVVGHGPVQASAGEDVVLSCFLEPQFDVSTLTVEWTRNDLIVHLYRNRNDNYDEQDEQFRGRTSLFRHELSRGNISLKLSNVQKEDSGLYSCYVPRLESTVKRGNVHLTVNPQKNPAGREETGGNNETEDDKKQSGGQRGVVVGIVAGVAGVGGVILVSAGIVFYSKRKETEGNNQENKQKYDQRREGPDTEEKKPLESVHV